MTWLRIDTITPRSDVIGYLAQELDVPLMHAFGLYVACLLGFGDHQQTGDLGSVPDRTLEQWAGWTGSPGTFAAAFRARCTADGTRQDAPGTVRGWWRQRALLAKQVADAAKRKGEPPERPPNNPRGFLGGTREGSTGHDNNNGNGTKELPVVGGASAIELGYLLRCVIAFNAGLAANPTIGTTRREVSTSEQQGRVTWETDGIPIEVAEQTIMESARAFQSSERSRQPHSLKYFDAAVRRAWEVHRQPVGTVTDPFDAAIQRLEAKHATR